MSTTHPHGSLPRIRWGRIAALHFSAALAVMVVYLALASPNMSALTFFPIGIPPVLLGGALPPYLVAVITWWLATAWGRGRIREVLAVTVGALVGSLVPLFFLRLLGLPADAIAVLAGSVAGCSAVGFATWVLVAWRRPAVGSDTTSGEPSLN